MNITLERIRLIRSLPVQTDNNQSYRIVIVHIATIYDHVPEVAKPDHFSKHGAFISNELSQAQVSTNINFIYIYFVSGIAPEQI